ncbi:MAG: glutamate racemase [Candidatus Beckwithbacteria bacterium]|nr:glutamate racemase [Patescibacteria group bacterium]
MANRPLGIIDSGLGGLSILKAITSKLKKENIIYLADHKYCPFGDKTTKEINQRLSLIMKFLLKKNCKAVVIACNTVTTSSIKFLRSIYPTMHFIGTVPAIKPAIEKNLKHNIIVLATHKTINSNYHQQMVDSLDKKGKVVGLACPGLVEAIETGNKQKITLKLKKILKKIQDSYSALVLGCTHYILIKDLIKKLAAPSTIIIEPSKAIANQTKKILGDNNLLSNIPSRDGMLLLTTGDPKKVSQVASKLLKNSIIFDKCSI